MNKLLHQYQSVLLSIALLVVSIVGLFLGVLPLANKVVDTIKQNKAMTKEIEVFAKKDAILQELDEDELRSQLVSALTAVPQQAAVGSVLTTVERLSQDSGVVTSDFLLSHVGRVTTDSAKKKKVSEPVEGATAIKFSFSISGPFSQVQSFLQQATNVRRYLTLESVEISRGQGDLSVARVSMHAFYSPLPTSVGAIAQEIQPLSQEDMTILGQIEAKKFFATNPDATVQVTVGKQDPFSK